MKENRKYTSIQRILQKVSLTRRDSDWEKMNVLLNKHLPVKTTSVHRFHSVKLWVLGSSVVLTATVAALVYTKIQNEKKQKVGMVIVQSVVKPADSVHEALFPVAGSTILQKSSSDSARMQKKEMVATYKLPPTASGKIPVIAPGDQNNNPQRTTASDQIDVDNSGRKQTEKSGPLNQTHSATFEIPYASTTYTPKEKLKSANARTDHVAGIQGRKSSGYQVLKGSPLFLSEQALARDSGDREKHRNWISHTIPDQKDLSDKTKIAAANKAAGKKMKGNSYVLYGVSLPLVQYNLSNPDQTFKLNYIPGITGQYIINNHWALGLNIFPYQKISVSDKDSVFSSFGRDSSISPFNSYNKKYYLNNLNAWAGEFRLGYQINRSFEIEAGLGIQGIWNATGYIKTTQDSIYNQPNGGGSATTQNIRYGHNDQSVANLAKTNIYYFMNLVYHWEKWSVSLGYNRNGRSWLSSAQEKSPAWMKLQFNYYFSTRKK